MEKGQAVTAEVQNDVTNFYNDDEFSRLMAGKKDFVSMGEKLHIQKRILQCDLKELFSTFTKFYPDIKMGFSNFCS